MHLSRPSLFGASTGLSPERGRGSDCLYSSTSLPTASFSLAQDFMMQSLLVIPTPSPVPASCGIRPFHKKQREGMAYSQAWPLIWPALPAYSSSFHPWGVCLVQQTQLKTGSSTPWAFPVSSLPSAFRQGRGGPDAVPTCVSCLPFVCPLSWSC